MTLSDKLWTIQPPITVIADQNLNSFPRILRQILFNRGIVTENQAIRYLRAETQPSASETRINGLDAAVQRISYAIRNSEKIIIYGDYDVDGVTATALLTFVLDTMEADVEPYIPNRFDEGYGLNPDAIRILAEVGVDLIVTVDCGIRSIHEAELARDLDIDLIITDHHHPGDELPQATVIINPKQPTDSYPEKDLAGVGLAYKLAVALISEMEDERINPEDLLELVALGTVADLAPLTGENRSLVRRGLKRLRRTSRQGLLSLMEVSSTIPSRIVATDIGFRLGPRLNAAGRLETAQASLDLLLTRDVFKAGLLAQQLEVQNRERQKITREMQEIAEAMILQNEELPLLLFAAHTDFNPGVVGLAASRLLESYYRPAIVAHIGEEFTRGSCRSIKEFHITDALDECSDLLVRHGGHAAAAGFTVKNELLPEFFNRLMGIAERQLANIDLRPSLVADAEVTLHELLPLVKYLDDLEPTGYGNPQPQFISRDLAWDNWKTRTVGQDNSHLKLVVFDGPASYDAIAFRQGHWLGKLPRRIDLLYTFEINEFNGRQNLQLNVKDIKESGKNG